MKHTTTDTAAKADELKQAFWRELAGSPYLFLQRQGDSTSAVPMSPQLDKDADSAIWFFTHKHSAFAALGPVTATFVSKGHDMFARFDGTLTVEPDRARFEQFWNNFVAAWYDQGKDDPDLLFLRMDLGRAEIWSGEMGLLDTAKMALGMNVHDSAEERHVQTAL
ncbi:pyridoxamine 5'-phosphate oxidase family protein [Altererythrobacter sp. H2]|uniref:pyridoxamine 5'-phosphate oxidase family protein n=1 Tax=Altererythrobacter sp. H2 TaxID=3108391 RepID=UPI002B4BA94B|nr:pyridoxamine 5'-phosphate oxidase family protein [Altererythrobacter sp. H2]WRK94858.1 pyridoxamine 5'-phosphate oxidase family protein [Altererythrobacter sp. H2]